LQAKGVEGKLSKGDSEAMAAIERKIAKNGFDVGIRSIYIAKKDVFTMSRWGGVLGAFAHFNSSSLNGFRPVHESDSEYPFENYYWDWGSWEFSSVKSIKKTLFRDYVARGWFYTPYKNKRKPSVLNVEELASIYHIPGGMNVSPGVVTVGSRKAEPPANLPV